MAKKTIGRYGNFGGGYIPEILVEPVHELTEAWDHYKNDADFQNELDAILKTYAGRPTPLTEVSHFAEKIQGPTIYLKREDLLHTGAHKLNNCLGQCLLAKRIGKSRVIAETGAGQHGVATATACAYLGLKCVVFMGRKDTERQALNVKKIRLLGAHLVPVDQGSGTLKEAINEAMREWSRCCDTTHYCLGSVLGPHPYPEMVARFQHVIGVETKEQCLQQCGRQPDLMIACVGGGSNAIGFFSAFLDNTKIKLVGIEGGGTSKQLGQHSARFSGGSPGVLHGTYSYLLQDENGNIAETASIAAGLDYPSIGPQHANLFEEGRVTYDLAHDDEVLVAFKTLSQSEGIIPALESSHALAYLMRVAPSLDKNSLVVVNLSGRGDKDLPTVLEEHGHA